MNKPTGYYDGVNKKLYESIPKGEKKILELGCANGRLGELYKSNNPLAHWTGVDYSESAVALAKTTLDRAEQIDLNNFDTKSFFNSEKFDVIVIGDLLEHLQDPESTLEKLHEISHSDTEIVCCLPNMAHISVFERLLTCDFTYDEMGLLDKTHLRLYSPASASKTFLNSGWIPNLVDGYMTQQVNSPFIQNLIKTIACLGLPERTIHRNLGLYQMIFRCRRAQQATSDAAADGKLGVIVPMNRQWEFDLNASRSPGLKEINAKVVVVQGAKTAADAFDAAKNNLDCEWILFMHQDVYIPKGAGFLLLEALEKLNSQKVDDVPIGFAGLSYEQNQGGFRKSGMVVDRSNLFNHPGSSTGISLDEFAIVLRKESNLKIDPNLGWHTWATDLCLQSMNHSGKPNTIILEIPFFHNSLNDYTLPPAYDESASRLLEKYPKINSIPTLCKLLTRQQG